MLTGLLGVPDCVSHISNRRKLNSLYNSILDADMDFRVQPVSDVQHPLRQFANIAQRVIS
jgi:hypothetical protein